MHRMLRTVSRRAHLNHFLYVLGVACRPLGQELWRVSGAKARMHQRDKSRVMSKQEHETSLQQHRWHRHQLDRALGLEAHDLGGILVSRMLRSKGGKTLKQRYKGEHTNGDREGWG